MDQQHHSIHLRKGKNGDNIMIKSMNDKMEQLIGKASKDLVNGGTLPLLFSGNNLNWLSNNRLMSGPPPRPLVICGPSGSGKSTLLKHLLDEFGEYFGFSVSHTTRKPRPGEVHGRDYFFVEREEMEEAINRGEFIEFAEFSGNIYGTSKKAVKDVQDQGRICILDIEIEGVKSIKKTDLNPHYIFIKPPNMDTLEDRLRGRGTETEESINKRLKKAREEMAYGETQGNFDLVLVNDDVTETYKNLRSFLRKDIDALKKS